MDFVFSALGALDLLSAGLLWFPFSETILAYASLYMLAKGFFFFLSTVSSRSPNPPFLMLCIVDLLTGVALGLLGFGFVPAASASIGFIGVVRLVSIAKGLYSLAVSLK